MGSRLRFDETQHTVTARNAFVRSRMIRHGFSLLELMLALALLGGLLAVAWSLLGTFRDAETRGWKLAHQTQTVRAARRWLQQDLDLAVEGSQPLTIFGPTSRPPLQFKGDTLGFSVLVRPDIDSLPFFESILDANNCGGELRSPNTARPAATAVQYASSAPNNGNASNPNEANGSPWPHVLLRIEYQLQTAAIGPERAMGDVALVAQQKNASTDRTEAQYLLIRRELYDSTLVRESLIDDDSANQNGTESSSGELRPADRELTAADLYRQNDEQDDAIGGEVLREAKLHGLVAPQFRYSDGKQWLSEWNSGVQGGLPAAVSLSFDFPARSELQRPEPSPAFSQPASGETFTEQEIREEGFADETSQASFAETVLDAQPIAEMEGRDKATQVFPTTHQVQIVAQVRTLYTRDSRLGADRASAEGNGGGETWNANTASDRGFALTEEYP